MGDGFQADDAARLGNKRVERGRRAVPAGCVELAGRGEREGERGLGVMYWTSVDVYPEMERVYAG